MHYFLLSKFDAQFASMDIVELLPQKSVNDQNNMSLKNVNTKR